MTATGRRHSGHRAGTRAAISRHRRPSRRMRCTIWGMPSTSQAKQPQPHVAVLDGVLERVTFCNPETGYTIARVAPDRGTGRGPVSASTELVTAVGPLLGGRWSSHVKYGRQ